MTARTGVIGRLRARYSRYRTRILVVTHVAWLLVVLVLGAWWGTYMYRQSRFIAELETRLGFEPAVIQAQLDRVHRMVFWELGSFIVLLGAITTFLLWLYWRDYLRSRSVHAFFASLTHELKTPLTSIRLQAEAISEGLAAQPAQGELVHRLLEDTMRLESQVERTLELARVEGGGSVLPQPLAFKRWLDRFVSIWKQGRREPIAIEASVDEELSIQADPAAIQVIFRNLLDNTIRHARKDRDEGPLVASVSAESRGSSILVHYEDNGRGYDGDPADLGKLFQKGAESQGAGVGLYLVRVLMERMGGEVTFRGGPSFGATLVFREGRQDG